MTVAPEVPPPCLDHEEGSRLNAQKDRGEDMAQSVSNSKSSSWRMNQNMGSPEAAAHGFPDELLQQEQEQRLRDDPKLPSSLSEDQIKVEIPVWMAGAASSKQHSPNSQRRLKWCGCLASSQCAHFTESYVPDADLPSSCNQWTPLPFYLPDGAQQHRQQGIVASDLFVDRTSGACTKPISSERLFAPLHNMKGGLNMYAGRSSGDGVAEKKDSFREPLNLDVRQIAKWKAQILAHPMYEQLLAAHVGCLRVATPFDHLQTIEAQLATTHHIAARYSMLGHNASLVGEEKDELDRFMASYIMLLQSFKEQLQEHIRVHAMEAVVTCWELEQALVGLTGASLGDGTGATMSDEDEEQLAETGFSCYDPDFFEANDNLGLGPLIPTETERSLMERVRQELKAELKQGYRTRIADVREEILRKRRAGKLPSETTSILKKWWNAHSKWPYPTEDEKARLVQETGLELKQINNWFINQRKRNWHSHPSTSITAPRNDISVNASGGQASNVSLSLSCDTENLQNDQRGL